MRTDRALSTGVVRDDGLVFYNYVKGKERWVTPEAFHRARISILVSGARSRASSSNIAFDVDIDYLETLYPSDGKCPALGIPLSWGDASGRGSSPSIDRVDPDLGYVRGNVQWLSTKANAIKSNATIAEICAVADYLKTRESTQC